MAVSFGWGAWLTLHGHDFRLGLPPLYGHFHPWLTPYAVPAVVLAVLGAWFAPQIAARVRWGWLVVIAGVASGAWGAALALVQGTRGLRLHNRLASDFINAVPMVHS